MDNVMKENANRKTINKKDVDANNNDVNVVMNDQDFSGDAQVQAVAKLYRHEDTERKVVLMISLMMNIMFLVTAYTILCYDTTGRLFGRLLGINL